MALIDHTQPFVDGMFALSVFPRVSVERVVRIEERGLNVTKVEFAVHSGTHLDAPRHFFANGRSIDQLSLEEVSGPAVGLAVERGPVEEITAADLEANSPLPEPGEIVFLHTGWGRHFHGDHALYHRHPYLSEDAADWLVERRVKMLAVDVATPDLPEGSRPPGFNWPVHHRLLGNGTLIAEHLNNLDQVVGRRFRAFAFPLPIQGSDGSPARVVAEV